MRNRQRLALAGRLLVGALLVYAGASKAAAPKEEFALIIGAYGLVPRDFLMPMAAFLPWLELLAGWALLLGVRVRAAAGAAGAMFAMFLLALASVTARGIELPNCGCFGESFHVSPKLTFVLDAVSLSFCWLLWKEGSSLLSLDSWSERGQ